MSLLSLDELKLDVFPVKAGVNRVQPARDMEDHSR